jgi:hypothetical protein
MHRLIKVLNQNIRSPNTTHNPPSLNKMTMTLMNSNSKYMILNFNQGFLTINANVWRATLSHCMLLSQV